MARKRRGQPDRRGGPDNAIYIQCPGSYMYPDEIYPPEVVALARGWGITREMGRCQHCGKLLLVSKYGWVSRHKRLHDRGWDKGRFGE